ncbi:hypothetical protein EJ04DRAFT_195910 [Polyplosphaeria fusca]|uniref:Uncharacterized protein n=1 Tax=Polyplosphaeria fusca TaxID=682080 RepID=A0A9P4QXI3_9PLEO|nr:hypothetical protein EJ04DRAFT_195910 [Polyplosphaeria fusca]
MVVRVPGNDAAKLKFFGNPNALCVLNTRAMRVQVSFGNFAGWYNAEIDKGNIGHKKMHWPIFRPFREFVNSHYAKNSTISSVGLEETILVKDGNAKKLTENRFYAVDTKVNNPYTVETKGSNSRVKRRGLGTVTGSGPYDKPHDFSTAKPRHGGGNR